MCETLFGYSVYYFASFYEGGVIVDGGVCNSSSFVMLLCMALPTTTVMMVNRHFILSFCGTYEQVVFFCVNCKFLKAPPT